MSLKKKVAALIGADRPKVIVVIAVTRAAAERSLAWLMSSKTSGYPYWCFCAEDGEALPGFDRYVPLSTADGIARELRDRWCALTIVSWTGEPGYVWFKLAPLFRPPFRLLFLNNTGDLFGPPLIPKHAARRLHEIRQNGIQRAKDIFNASLAWIVRNSRQQSAYLHAVGIRGLAFLAKVSAPLVRIIFRKFRGNEHLELHLPPAADLSYVEIEITNREWEPHKIREALCHATESIVIFRQNGETTPVGPLLEVFREEAVFAASLQVQYTDWRKKLLPKFPVRKLQPGEICRTTAPYSSLLAMNRNAVLQFGIPEVSSSGCAYMLLCWQAAAAGLASYTIGADRAVVHEMNVALEDAEFVKAVLTTKSLRSLSPLQPDLGRGNIATSLQNRRQFSGKPRVLLVSPYLPYPLSHGGAVRIFNLCRVLAARVDFILACFREALDTVHYDVLSNIFCEVHVVDNDEKNIDAELPKQIPEYRNSSMHSLIRHLCATRKVDLMQIEYTQMAEYRDCAGGIPVLLVEHDVTFTLYRQIWETKPDKEAEGEYRRWLNFETKALREADCIWAMSNQDREVLLEQGAAPGYTFTVPNGVDLRRFQPQPKPDAVSRVLFVGSFRHLPNLLAFEKLRDEIMPAVWKAIPDAKLYVIAGPQHERCAGAAGKESLLRSDPRIVLEGFVEDVRPAYANATVVAIPLPVSAGTNIKLMEAMACGRAVVSTPVGCAGLELQDSVDLFIRPVDAGFAEAIIELMRNRAMRDQMASTARRTAEKRFGWEAIAEQAFQSYESLLAKMSNPVAV